ncbi:MAG: hypothetical protein FWE20_12045, partial [Defluviitaleaceae bacterium]|nr:hypothetical protein [Defluviitaleaceae bacterium]
VLRRTGTDDCARYVGRVFVDDVYSDGEMYQIPMGYSSWRIPAARFMRRARYPKLSEAVAGGLYHYGCKCWHVSYFEGVTPTDYQGESIPSFTWYALHDKEPSLPYGYDIQPYTNEDAVILLVREVMELRGMNPQRERGLVARTMSPRRVNENNPFEQRANQYLVSKFGANFAETNEAYQVYLTVLNILVDAAMMNGASPQSISDSFIDSMFASAFGERLNAADLVGSVMTGLGLAAAAAGGVAAGAWWRQSRNAIPTPVVGGNIPLRGIGGLPPNAQASFKLYDAHGWSGMPPGLSNVRAGRLWHNKSAQLPSHDRNGNPITYREFDVNSQIPGQSRDAQRFVVGSDGSIFFTDNHYNSFMRIR